MTLKAIFLFCFAAFSLGAFAEEESRPLPDPLYFSQDWCPFASEREVLDKHFKLTSSDCCIFRAERRDWNDEAALVAIQPMLSRVSVEQDLSFCRGDNPDLKHQRDKDAQKSEGARRAMAAEERKDLAVVLRKMDIPMLCVEAAKLIRGERWFVIAPNMQQAALPYIQAELKRRGVPLNEKRVKFSTFNVGDSECQLYAARGLPTSQNRTITGSSRNVQHVYPGSRNYVYTTDGRISGLQN